MPPVDYANGNQDMMIEYFTDIIGSPDFDRFLLYLREMVNTNYIADILTPLSFEENGMVARLYSYLKNPGITNTFSSQIDLTATGILGSLTPEEMEKHYLDTPDDKKDSTLYIHTPNEPSESSHDLSLESFVSEDTEYYPFSLSPYRVIRESLNKFDEINHYYTDTSNSVDEKYLDSVLYCYEGINTLGEKVIIIDDYYAMEIKGEIYLSLPAQQVIVLAEGSNKVYVDDRDGTFVVDIFIQKIEEGIAERLVEYEEEKTEEKEDQVNPFEDLETRPFEDPRHRKFPENTMPA